MLTTTEIHELPMSVRMLEDVQILVVDNDFDNRALYAALLEHQGAQVTTTASIEGALDLLDGYIPNLLICELNFLGESVLPLIQQVKTLAFSRGRLIPILVISTCNPISVVQRLTVNIEAYFLKPINVDDLVDKVGKLVAFSSPHDGILLPYRS